MKKIHSTIAVALTLCVLVFSLCACSSKSSSEKDKKTNITKLSFATLKSPCELGVGEVDDSWFSVSHTGDFSVDELDFYSSNPEVASFKYSKTELESCIYYELKGVSEGQATVYVQTKDGSVKSEEIEVTVTPAIKKLKFAALKSPCKIKVGDKDRHWFSVDADGEYTIDDLEFYSSDPNVATIEYDETALDNIIYCNIIGKSAGECTVYIKAKAGDAKTDEIKVIVS